jgi:hypothetical protein
MQVICHVNIPFLHQVSAGECLSVTAWEAHNPGQHFVSAPDHDFMMPMVGTNTPQALM